MRFSKDKTPYNVHVSAVVSRGGRKDLTFPGLYLRFDAEKTQMVELKDMGAAFLAKCDEISLKPPLVTFENVAKRF